MKRKARGTTTLCDADARIILRSWLPYSRKNKNKGAHKKTAENGGK